MPQASLNPANLEQVKSAILQTVAFFSLYDLPVSLASLHQNLYKTFADFESVKTQAQELARDGKLVFKNELYALKEWDETKLEANKTEIAKRLRKVKKYLPLLAVIPFVDQISIINSLAMGNADQESDIDFFVVTRPGTLYFVRSVIIVLFRFLGVYKTRKHSNKRFCFGFYITSDHLDLSKVLLPGDDPHFAFWFASFAPLLNRKNYERLVSANPWIYGYFPNFDLDTRLMYLEKRTPLHRLLKLFFEIIAVIPALALEPILRKIHIKHTFGLPENHWSTSTTVANAHMLKLHALDPRKDIRQKFYDLLQSLR